MLARFAKLMQARESGEGGYIDCSMLGCLVGVAALQTSEYFGTGNTPRPLGSAHPRNAPYQAFKGSDDYFIIAAGNDRLWTEVAEAAGKAKTAVSLAMAVLSTHLEAHTPPAPRQRGRAGQSDSAFVACSWRRPGCDGS